MYCVYTRFWPILIFLCMMLVLPGYPRDSRSFLLSTLHFLNDPMGKQKLVQALYLYRVHPLYFQLKNALMPLLAKKHAPLFLTRFLGL